MTTAQILWATFAILIVGLTLPLSGGVRSGLFTALVALTAFTAIGSGTLYLLSFFG